MRIDKQTNKQTNKQTKNKNKIKNLTTNQTNRKVKEYIRRTTIVDNINCKTGNETSYSGNVYYC